jgi:integrase
LLPRKADWSITMRRILTVNGIKSLKPAEAGTRYDAWDSLVPGFGVRVTDRGNKSYILVARYPGHRNPTRRVIAQVDAMELVAARDTARAWLAKIFKRVDPRTEHGRKRADSRRREELFADVSRRFLEQHVFRNKLRTAVEIERVFNKYLIPRWGKLEFVTIRRGDVARLLDDIEKSAPSQADHVLGIMSKLCNWYMAREESYTTPIVRGMRRTRPSERARRRVLDDRELRLLWQASAEVGVYGGMLRTALLTAQRRGKVLSMRWQEISDDGTWTILTEPREKSNARSLRLPPLALDIIMDQPVCEDSDYVFAGRGGVPLNGYSKAKAQLDERLTELNGAPLPRWTVHDLRRTAKSLMARSGIRPDISERVLGHAIAGIEGVYDRYCYEDEKAEALARLANLVMQIVENKVETATVIPIRARAYERQQGLRSTG